MTDQILEAFLAQQHDEALALQRESDLLSLLPLGSPADRYLVELRCRGLVERRPGDIVEADRFQVGVAFSSTYLRQANPYHVLTWLGPQNVWHPNILAPARVVCLGRLPPGTGLVDILYQLFEIVTWNKVAMHDGLNQDACQWARRHPERFPVDRRPLKRQPLTFDVSEVSKRSEGDGLSR